MISETTINERRYAEIVADEYRRRGYDVTQDAPLDFLPGVSVDLLARRGDEARVIEVKARASLAASPHARWLAGVVNAKPGWTFDLVLVGDTAKVDTPAGKTAPLTAPEIARRLKDAETALANEAPESAFLTAWSAGEALLRVLLADAGVPPERLVAPTDVFSQAVFHGIISRECYSHFTELRKCRNAILHGFGVHDFDNATAASLIAVVNDILVSPPD